MHESFSVYPSTHHKTFEGSASKSLYEIEPKSSGVGDGNLNR
jgi:hypothetical protein